MSRLWEPDAESELVIGRLRSADPAKERGKTSARVGLRDIARMLIAGLFLGALFLAGTLGLPKLGLRHPEPAVLNPRPANADPYAEARLSREILDQQSGAPGEAAPPRRRNRERARAEEARDHDSEAPRAAD